MTTVISIYTNNLYNVSIGIERRYESEIYIVQACPCINEHMCGHPEREMIYPISERSKAYATYRRYVKKYCR